MATLNVYLPDALKAEMDSTEGINWSRVAQEAFRKAVLMERVKQANNRRAATRLGRNRIQRARNL